MQDPTKPLIMSNSGVSVFNLCERSGYHQYIAKTAPDKDYIRPKYFAFGTAFHTILEKTKHDRRLFLKEVVIDACNENDLIWENDGAKLYVILRSYWELISKTRFKMLAYEQQFKTDVASGKIDFICEDENELWYIGDTKTSGVALSPTKKVELINDPQMNLYGAFADVLAEKLQLDPEKWGGVIYRETEKPRHKYKFGESFDEFHDRICKNGLVKSREIIITRDELNWDNAYKNFLGMVCRARDLQTEWLEGKETTSRQDFKNCKVYGNTCKYWSQCYGKIYSECQELDTKKLGLDVL